MKQNPILNFLFADRDRSLLILLAVLADIVVFNAI